MNEEQMFSEIPTEAEDREAFDNIFSDIPTEAEDSEAFDNIFSDVEIPTEAEDIGETPQLAETPSRIPVKPIPLSFKAMASRMLERALPSMLENIGDTLAILDPGFQGGDDVLTIPGVDWAPFPNVQRLVRLAAEVGIATGQETADLAGIDFEKRETPMLDAVIEYYRNNYGLGPDGIEGFKRYLSEDPFGVVTDILAVASFGAGALRATGKVANIASNAKLLAKHKSRIQKYVKQTEDINRAVNQGFSIPKPDAGKVWTVVNKAFDNPVARRLYNAKRGPDGKLHVDRGLSEIADPGALALGKTLDISRSLIGKVAKRIERPTAKGEDVELVTLADQVGIKDLPLSARLGGSKWAARGESLLLNQDNAYIIEQFERTAQQLDAYAAKIETDIAAAATVTDAGKLAVDAYEKTEEWVKTQSDNMYNSIAGVREFEATLENTYQTLHRIWEEAQESKMFGGIPSIDTKLAQVYPDIKAHYEWREKTQPDPQQTIDFTEPDTPENNSLFSEKKGEFSTVNTHIYFPDVSDHVLKRSIDKSNFRITFGTEGEAYQVRYKVIDLDDILPGDRPQDVDALANIDQRAAALDTLQLTIDFPDTEMGAPILNANNAVLSGNGRIHSIQHAYQNYPDQIETYNAAMRINAQELGIPDTAFEGVNRPVIVRELLSDVDETAFAQQANRSRGSDVPDTAQGAKILNDELLELFEAGDETDLRKALQSDTNKDFGEAFFNKIDPDERARFIDETGTLTNEGLTRLTNAITRETFQGLFGARMLNALSELRNTEEFSNIFSALEKGMPKLILSEHAVRTGKQNSNLTIAEDLAQAIEKVVSLQDEARRFKSKTEDPLIPIKEFFQATENFANEIYDLSEGAAMLMPIVAAGISRPKLLTDFLTEYADNMIGKTDKIPDNADKITRINNELAKIFPDEYPDLSALLEGFAATRKNNSLFSKTIPFSKEKGVMSKKGEFSAVTTETTDTPETTETTETTDTTRTAETTETTDTPETTETTETTDLSSILPPGTESAKYKHLHRLKQDIFNILKRKNIPAIGNVNEGQLQQVHSALKVDLEETVIQHRPELAPLVRKASAFWAEWKTRINEGWGKKLHNALGNPRLEDSGNPDNISKMLYSDIKTLNMSTAQIRGFYQLIGGFNSDAGRQLRALTVRRLIETGRALKESVGRKSKLTRDKAWKPLALRSELNSFNREHLVEFLGADTVNSLDDLADILVAFDEFSKKAHGSQTAFLAFMEHGKWTQRLTETIERLGWALFSAIGAAGGAAGGAAFGGKDAILLGSTALATVTAMIGPRAVEELITTDWGRNWLLHGIDPGKMFESRFRRTAAAANWARARAPQRATVTKAGRIAAKAGTQEERERKQQRRDAREEAIRRGREVKEQQRRQATQQGGR